jgi:hypothetical protein
MTDEPPDYMGMNGAEFQRAVGTDPEKWAEAFEQRMGRAVADSEFTLSASREARVAYMVGWFRDAMEAAVKAAHSGDWRQLLSE